MGSFSRRLALQVKIVHFQVRRNELGGLKPYRPQQAGLQQGRILRPQPAALKVWRPVGLGRPSSIHLGHSAMLPSACHLQSAGKCSSPINRFGQRLTT